MLHIVELIAASDAAYRALIGWMHAQRDQWRFVHYEARTDERFDLLLTEPRPYGFRPQRWLWFPVGRIIRGPMLRIVDVKQALSQRRYPADLPDPFVFELLVRDAELPENQGPWEIVVTTGAAHVTKRASDTIAARLETDAAGFAQIYAGELSVSSAAAINAASVEGAIELLDRAFQPLESYRLLDEF